MCIDGKKEKRKENTMVKMTTEKAKFAMVVIVICIISCAVAGFVNLFLNSSIEDTVSEFPPGTVPSLIQVQKAIGAEPDNIYGPETKRLWDKKIAEQIAGEFDKDFEAMNKSILETK